MKSTLEKAADKIINESVPPSTKSGNQFIHGPDADYVHRVPLKEKSAITALMYVIAFPMFLAAVTTAYDQSITVASFASGFGAAYALQCIVFGMVRDYMFIVRGK